jgi:bifunctional non-homologous end joining protein LigD
VNEASDAIQVNLAGHDVRLTNLDRVLWPTAGSTKGWLLQSYLSVAPVLLPHLRGHPVTMWRFPEGVGRNGWWQNECRGAPPWVATYRYVGKDGREHRHCVIDDEASLMWLVNLGTIEIHPFPSRRERADAARWLVFDLDPGEPAGVRDACSVAVTLRDALASQGLESFAKTSGSKGMHVFAPLNGTTAFDDAKRFARTVAAALASELPNVVDQQTRSLRVGKVLVDWLQNDRFRSTVAPYSLRATQPASVSTPVTWEEVDAASASTGPKLAFTVDEVVDRVERLGDLFEPVLSIHQTLPV